MLSEFTAATSSAEFNEDGWLRFRSVEWSDRELAIRVTIEASEIPRPEWRILCRDVRAVRLTGTDSGSIDISSKHPLLWPHVQLAADLYFNGRPESATAVFGELTVALHELVGNWFAVHEFVNRNVRSPVELLSS